MHILRIADVPNNRTGGMSHVMYGTGDAMEAAGHQVSYLFQEGIRAPTRATVRRLVAPWRLPRLIRNAMRHGRVDVVEIHEPLAGASCLLRGLNVKLPPIVILSHGLEERGFEAEVSYRRLKNIPYPLRSRLVGNIMTLHARYAARHADHVLCCNSQDVEYLKQKGVPAARLTRHFNAVDDSILEAGERLSSQVSPSNRILFLGSWLERKGTLDLIPAINNTLRTFPDATFTAAGCGVPEAEVLQAFAPDIRSRVRAISKIVSTDELISVYSNHGSFVLPSYFEGQPLVMIEAAALGLAIVTTDIGGTADFIKSGSNGLKVPVGDVNALEQALGRVCSDSTFARQLGTAARQTAQSHTWVNSANNILGAYQKALSAR